MIEVMYYECEFCGERFDDDWECKKHETTHMAESFPHDELLMWDKNGNRISVEDLLENPQLTENIYAVETANEEARDYIREMFYYYSGECPYDSHYFPDEKGLVYWDDDVGSWVCCSAELDKLTAIRAKYGKMGE